MQRYLAAVYIPSIVLGLALSLRIKTGESEVGYNHLTGRYVHMPVRQALAPGIGNILLVLGLLVAGFAAVLYALGDQ
jgi:hypothetical protein